MQGDITTLRSLQIQIYRDKAFNIFTINSEEKQDKLFEDDNIVKSTSKEHAVLLCSAAISGTKDDAKLYFGTQHGKIGRISLLRPHEKQNLELLELSNYKLNEDSRISHVAVPVNKTFSDVVIALDNHGSLHIVCSSTFLEIFVWKEENVLDFVLLEEREQMNLLLVTEQCNEIHQTITYALQIREYPSFKLIYKLIVNTFCKPMVSSSGQESPLIIEGSFINENQSPDVTNQLSALRIRGICEGNAEIRLGRLLRRNQFEEAEVVARLNGLDYEKIYQAKSSWLTEKLSPWKALDNQPGFCKDYKANLNELRRILGCMKNIDYMVRCCVGAILPSLKDTRDLIVLARKLTQGHLDKENFDQSLLSLISSTLQRLETFIYTYKDQSVTSTYINEVQSVCHENNLSIEMIDNWAAFSKGDMLVTIGKFLSERKIESALLVWQRHQAEFSHRLTSEQIRLLLDLIKPEEILWEDNSVNGETMFQWISQFIPDSLEIIPECLPTVADWITTATKRLELRDRKNWPLNGLTLARVSLEAIHLHHKNVDDNFQVNRLKSTRMPLTMYQQRSDKSSKLYILIELIESLNDLMTLHGELKIRIKLDDFIQEDKSEVCSHLIDWCTNSEEVTALFENFLLSFIRLSLFHYQLKGVQALAINPEFYPIKFWERVLMIVDESFLSI